MYSRCMSFAHKCSLHGMFAPQIADVVCGAGVWNTDVLGQVLCRRPGKCNCAGVDHQSNQRASLAADSAAGSLRLARPLRKSRR